LTLLVDVTAEVGLPVLVRVEVEEAAVVLHPCQLQVLVPWPSVLVVELLGLPVPVGLCVQCPFVLLEVTVLVTTVVVGLPAPVVEADAELGPVGFGPFGTAMVIT
jgi:hypothetical protein